jgi:hypothetical protein
MLTAWLVASVTLMDAQASGGSEPLSLELLSGTEWISTRRRWRSRK